MAGGPRSPAIDVVALRKTYGDVAAVAEVSLSVEHGEIFGILGHNGAGKTTTVECLQALRRPDGGIIRVAGADPVAHPGKVRSLVGSQLQSSSLPDRLRVGEALEFFARLRPGSRPPAELLDDWGLTGVRRREFGDLSGGQQQRLFVALALVDDPPVVVLDEMTTGLDPAARRVAWELVERVRDRGATVLLVTHFMDEAERLCDRVPVFSRGRVVALGAPAELVTRHAGATEVTFTTTTSPGSATCQVSAACSGPDVGSWCTGTVRCWPEWPTTWSGRAWSRPTSMSTDRAWRTSTSS